MKVTLCVCAQQRCASRTTNDLRALDLSMHRASKVSLCDDTTSKQAQDE
jgi:hypothetical protein